MFTFNSIRAHILLTDILFLYFCNINLYEVIKNLFLAERLIRQNAFCNLIWLHTTQLQLEIWFIKRKFQLASKTLPSPPAHVFTICTFLYFFSLSHSYLSILSELWNELHISACIRRRNMCIWRDMYQRFIKGLQWKPTSTTCILWQNIKKLYIFCSLPYSL